MNKKKVARVENVAGNWNDLKARLDKAIEKLDEAERNGGAVRLNLEASPK